MLTKEQAIEAHYFHPNGCSQTVGPRGGVKTRVEEWRRNGRTKTWVTRPSDWQIPVKHGMRDYGTITNHDANYWHSADECPLRTGVEEEANV